MRVVGERWDNSSGMKDNESVIVNSLKQHNIGVSPTPLYLNNHYFVWFSTTSSCNLYCRRCHHAELSGVDISPTELSETAP
jgi:hypothetical protein